jgi:hypothetical protein
VLHSRVGALDFLANIRQGWKGLPGTNTKLIHIFVSYDCKKFYNIGLINTNDAGKLGRMEQHILKLSLQIEFTTDKLSNSIMPLQSI